jgi:hypothetical protein
MPLPRPLLRPNYHSFDTFDNRYRSTSNRLSDLRLRHRRRLLLRCMRPFRRLLCRFNVIVIEFERIDFES